MRRRIFFTAQILFWVALAAGFGNIRAAPEITGVTDNLGTYVNSAVPKFGKLEITFNVQNTVAGNLQLPYDASPPAGVDPVGYPKHQGISVDAWLLPPGLSDWQDAYRQPAFVYQNYDDRGLAVGGEAWKVRFSPHTIGTWRYRLEAKDAGGTDLSEERIFEVINSTDKGFIRVSEADPRYFEYSDGSYFPAIGRQGLAYYDYPTADNISEYVKFGQNKVKLIRTWMSGFYGTSWQQWIGGRNIYDGYLPRSGLEGFRDPQTGREYLTLVVDHDSGSDANADWYDACRLQFHNNGEAIKPNTNYAVKVTYWGTGITGPRISAYPDYGLVVKIGDWTNNCQDPGNIPVVTNYGRDTANWSTISGIWNSGNNQNLPRVHISLENALSGKTWIREVSVREKLGNQEFGPEIITEHSMEYESYFPQRSAWQIDQAIERAEQNDIYLKLVIMDKDDMVWKKINDDGSMVVTGMDNMTGFYGLWRTVNKIRWLQNAYFRYLQARWGYSAHIHSWELTNEGETANGDHWALTDEMGKEFHCRIFGVSIGYSDGQKCGYRHPNAHLVTTSFWHSYPDADFWANPKYPNVDYADVHAYISTGWQGNKIHESDSALFHWDYAAQMRESTDRWSALAGIATKPIVRGETGMDYVDGPQEENPLLMADSQGVWLHNFTWAGLDFSGMTELYWWWETIDRSPGPDGNSENGLNEIYRNFYNFVTNIPLNNGSYRDSAANVDNSQIRVVGQKDLVNKRAHLWISNANHTWRNVVDKVAVAPQSGTVTLGGFPAHFNLQVEWWDTYQGQVTSSYTQSTNSNGEMVLAVNNLTTDTAVKIGDYDGGVAGDANGDGGVDGVDYVIWLNHYGQLVGGARMGDFDNSGKVDGVDYVIWLNHYGA